MADGGEEIEDFAIVCVGVAHAVGREYRKTERGCDAHRGLVAPLLLTEVVALEFDVDIFTAEDVDELLDDFAPGFFAAAHEGRGKRAFVSAGEAYKAGSILLQVVECGRAFLLGVFAQLALRDEDRKSVV